jgi:HD-like signal output (HDOD) protein
VATRLRERGWGRGDVRLKVAFVLPIRRYRGWELTTRRWGALHTRSGRRVIADDKSFSYPESGAKLKRQVSALEREAELFAPPQALSRLNRLLATAPVNLKKLEEAVNDDPQLVSEALKLCNSSLFRLPHPVARLEQAVIMMDAEITRALLIACWLIKRSGGTIGLQAHQGFWRHSLLVAQLSRHLCDWTHCGQPEWAFLAGLFHDVGALPILAMLSRRGGGSPQNDFEEVGDSLEPQRRRFGVHHCDLAQRMGFALGLPSWAVEIAARHHERKSLAAGLPLLSLARAAEFISQPRASSAAHPSSLHRRQLILNALGDYLPELSGPASSGLLDTIESDLEATFTHFGEVAAGVCEDLQRPRNSVS